MLPQEKRASTGDVIGRVITAQHFPLLDENQKFIEDKLISISFALGKEHKNFLSPTMSRTGSVYRSLTGSDIRLVRLAPGTTNENVGELVYVSLGKAPRYYAISYVWGEEEEGRSVSLNGQSFDVTSNLFELLQFLRRWQQEGRVLHRGQKCIPLDGDTLFWIDALCINQSNAHEKSVQIPRVGNIYRSASQVLAWLGPNGSPDENSRVEGVFEQANALESGKQDSKLGTFAFQRPEDGNAHTFLDTLIDILRRPWFSRVWVLQEASLAQEPAFILAGDAVTTIHKLFLLWARLHMYAEDRRVLRYLKAGAQIEHFESTRLEIQCSDWKQLDITNPLERFATQLCELLHRSGGDFHCKIPHDLIYGMLGMVDLPIELPEELQPDYERPWREVFEAYGRFLIETTRDSAISAFKLVNIRLNSRMTAYAIPSDCGEQWLPGH